MDECHIFSERFDQKIVGCQFLYSLSGNFHSWTTKKRNFKSVFLASVFFKGKVRYFSTRRE